MAKKRYSYVGVSLFLVLLIPIPVLSDAPPSLIEEQFRNLEGHKNSTEPIRGHRHISHHKKFHQVQGENNLSPNKTGIRYRGTEQGRSQPTGKSSVQEQKENVGTNNPSSRVLTYEATHSSPKKLSGDPSGRGQMSQPLPIAGENNTSPSGRKVDSANLTASPVGKSKNEATQNSTNKLSGDPSGTIPGENNTSPSGSKVDSAGLTASPVGKSKNEATQNSTNKLSGDPSGTGQMSQPLPIAGENNTSPSGRKVDSANLTASPGEKSKNDQIPSFNQSQQTQKHNPALVSNDVDSSTLNSFFKNPLVWLLGLLLLGLLALLLWWFRRRRQRQVNQYVDQIFEQKINDNVGFIINNIATKQDFKHYIDQYIVQQIDQTFERKIQNNIPLITHKLVNNNQELNKYVNHCLQHSIINDTKLNNEIVNFVANSTEINNKINKIYRDIDIKIEGIRYEWNQTFINLVRHYVDELINIIGSKETFNILIADLISVKVDELLNQISRTKNELILIMNNGDRHLYEWTLGELIAIKGCLTDRQALAEQLASFSAELRTKLDCTPCVDINKFERFKPISIAPKQQPQELPGS